MTPFGVRAESAGRRVATGPTAFAYLFWITVAILLLAGVARHLLGGGMQSHFHWIFIGQSSRLTGYEIDR
jgi:hypothetical protein